MENCIASHIIPKKEKYLCNPGVCLLFLYILGVSLRFALAFFFRSSPTISIDESLYINIAKSLASGEGIAYRSQPVPYPYIFYPLLLVPVYLFPFPFDLYRIIQLYNALLITSTIFPVYLFARDFTGNNRKALLSSLFTLLMPDMQMAGYLMSESVIWPLSLWLVFFACRLFLYDEKQIFSGIMSGFFAALLFWTKPGALFMGIVLLLFALFLGQKPHLQKQRLAATIGLIVCVGMVAFFYSLYVFGFDYQFSVLGLYDKQITKISVKWLIAVLEFSVLQLILFDLACGGVFFVLPYACFNNYSCQKKTFIFAFSCGLIVLAIGTAIFVDMYQWNGSLINPQLHLRYMAMFIPAMLVFSMDAQLSEKRAYLFLFISLLILAVLTIFPGGQIGFVRDESTCIDSIALSAYMKSDLVPAFPGVLLTIFSTVFFLLFGLQITHNNLSASWKTYCLVFFSFILFCHNFCGYKAGNHVMDQGSEQDAIEINAVLETIPSEYLIVTQSNYQEPQSYKLESHLRKPAQQVTIDALASALSETGGVYYPFIPEDQDPNVGNHITPDTDTFLCGATVAEHIEFSPYVDLKKSKNEWYTLVKVPTGQRFIDTILTGVNLFFLPKDRQAQLYVFDDARFKDGKMTLHLIAGCEDSSAPSSLEITNGENVVILPLTEELDIYQLSLEEGEILFTARGGEAVILTYWTD